jgi:hypothetical protein
MTESDEDSLFGETDAELALEGANDEFGLVGAGGRFGEEALDDFDLGVLRLRDALSREGPLVTKAAPCCP